MRKTTSTKALAINLHTVRQLSAVELGTAAGAGSLFKHCGTITCASSCAIKTDTTCATITL